MQAQIVLSCTNKISPKTPITTNHFPVIEPGCNPAFLLRILESLQIRPSTVSHFIHTVATQLLMRSPQAGHEFTSNVRIVLPTTRRAIFCILAHQ